jgi:hypothetical protein
MRLLLIVVLAGAALAQGSPGLVDFVDPVRLREDLSYLAGDEFRGRNTPSPELDKAALWLEDAYRKAGLQPAFGESFRDGPRRPDVGRAKASLRREKATDQLRVAIGVDTPAEGRDLKVVRDAADLGDAAKGAAVIVIPDPGQSLRRSLRGRANALHRQGAKAILLSEGHAEVLAGVDLLPLPVLLVPDEVSAWSGEQVAAAAVDFEIPLSDQFYASNVAAILPGSDPSLAAEWIAFGAHYDHIGTGEADGKGDTIRNGADDNASGTIAVLNIARAFRQMKVAPKRSCLFLAFYGEERGFQGSRRFVANPAVPLRQVRALFNLEMLGRPDDIEANSAWVTGYSVSSFGEIVSKLESGVRFYEHPVLSRRLFAASDNLPFAEKGVPAHSISAGSLHADYHQPSDEVKKIDFVNYASVVRGIARVGWAMADGGPVPEWKAGTSYAAAAERLRESK